MILLNSLLLLVALLYILSDAWCRPSSCLWIKAILLPPFQSLCLLFLWLTSLHCLPVPTQCWLEVLSWHPFLTPALRSKTSSFTDKYGFSYRFFHRYLIRLRTFPSIHSLLLFLWVLDFYEIGFCIFWDNYVFFFLLM